MGPDEGYWRSIGVGEAVGSEVQRLDWAEALVYWACYLACVCLISGGETRPLVLTEETLVYAKSKSANGT